MTFSAEREQSVWMSDPISASFLSGDASRQEVEPKIQGG
jgi:hypothetical protein